MPVKREDPRIIPPADLYWDDLSLDDRVVSPGRTIGEADILAFAGLSGDYNQLHMDAEYAASETGFTRRVAHGLLGLSVASGLFTRTWLGTGIQRHMIAMLEIQWKFVAPLFAGETVRLEAEITNLRATSNRERGIAILDRRLVDGSAKVLQHGTTTMLIRRRVDGATATQDGSALLAPSRLGRATRDRRTAAGGQVQ